MAVITYTAKRKLMSGHTSGQRYTFDVGLEDWTPNPETPGSSSTSLSGRNFETLHRIEDAWQARTLAYDDPSVIAQLDEFLASVAAGEQFEIDPFGTIANPDENIVCKLRGTSKWSKDIANTAGPYYRYSFKAWKAQGLSSAIIDILNTADFSRASAAWAWGSDQLLDEYAAGELRRDYDPANGAFRGVLVEESRTNQLLDNRDLSTGNWFVSGSPNIAQNETGLDGQLNTAHTITEAGGSSDRLAQIITVPDDSNTYRLIFPIKMGGSTSVNLRANLRNGTTQVVSSLILDSTDGSFSTNGEGGQVFDAGSWWLVIVQITNNSSGNTSLRYQVYPDTTASGQSCGYDFGQIELNTDTPSSLIETGGTATTRAADVLEGAFSVSSGTLHFVGEHDGGDGVLWQADDGTENERLRLYVATGDVLFDITVGGIVQDQFNLGALASDGTYDVAIRFAQEDFAACMNGGTVISSTDDDMPAVDTCRFGRDTSATEGINWYKRGDLRRALLTDAQLQELTG